MSRITEYVGKEGVKSTEADWLRFKKPRPGDLIRWPNGKLGMIEDDYDSAGSWAKEGEVHAIATQGSAFLGWDEDKRRATVSISGGPFLCVKAANLEPEGGTYNARFWNWGDNFPGADKEWIITCQGPYSTTLAITMATKFVTHMSMNFPSHIRTTQLATNARNLATIHERSGHETQGRVRTPPIWQHHLHLGDHRR